MLLQSWYYQKNSVEAWVDTLWWSLISIFVYGFMALYFAGGGDSNKAGFIMLGFLFWDVTRLAQESVSLAVLRDIWSRNLSNIFTTPLTIAEFFTAVCIFGLFKSVAVFTISATVAYFTYGFSILTLGWWLPIYVLSLFFFSISFGIFVLGLLFRFGMRIQAFAWGLIVILQPIVGVFYPLSILPTAIQYIAYAFPITYIYESARQTMLTGEVNIPYILISFALNIVYASFALLFFNRMFKASRDSGTFARLEG